VKKVLMVYLPAILEFLLSSRKEVMDKQVHDKYRQTFGLRTKFFILFFDQYNRIIPLILYVFSKRTYTLSSTW
jgi:hypothetical protein